MDRTWRFNRVLAMVALSGVAGLVCLVLVVARANSKGPRELLALAERAQAAGDLELARRYAAKAYDRADSPDLRKTLLWRLAGLYSRLDQWPRTMACWERILQEDPCDIKAQLAVQESQYVQADGWARLGGLQVGQWRQVQAKADALLTLVTGAGLQDSPLEDWRVPGFEDARPAGPGYQGARMGPYLEFLKGRAIYQIATSGAAQAPADALQEAAALLDRASTADPCLAEACWYLYKVRLAQADAMQVADPDAASAARARALEVLQRAVDLDGAQAIKHVYLLEARLGQILAQRDYGPVRSGLSGIEPDYDLLITRFGRDLQALACASKFYLLQAYYQGPATRNAHLQKAIDTAQAACKVDPNDIRQVLALAELYYRRAVLAGTASDAEDAFVMARSAAEQLGDRPGGGPRAAVVRATALQIWDFVARSAMDQLLDDQGLATGPEGRKWAGRLDQAVEQMAQIVPAEGHQVLVKWRAFQDLVHGRTERAFMSLYRLYERGKAGRPDGSADPWTCYVLARLLAASPELGKAVELMAESLRMGMGFDRPAAVLDYLRLLGRIGMWAHIISPANPYNLDAYDWLFGRSEPSLGLRIMALAGTGQLAEAELLLGQARPDQLESASLLPARIQMAQAKIERLQTSQAAAALQPGMLERGLADDRQDDATLRQLRAELADLVFRLAQVDPTRLEEPMVVSCARFLSERGQDERARAILEGFIATRPEGAPGPAMARFTLAVLARPGTEVISAAERDQLFEQTLKDMNDPVDRALQLGMFYSQNDQIDRAIEHLSVALELARDVDWSQRRPAIRQPFGGPLAAAADQLCELAIGRQDWSLAEKVAAAAGDMDIDGCGGLYYQARLLHAKGQHRQALGLIEQALEKRPAFSGGLLLRASIRTALGQDKEAVADMEQAAALCPTSPAVARGLAISLYSMASRRGLADRMGSQVRSALEQALRLDPADPMLLSMYANQIRDAEPLRALQVYQVLLKRDPSVQNALAIADLATEVASRGLGGPQRATLLEIARAALEHAYAMEPNNPAVIEEYARYYSELPDPARAQQMLSRLAKVAGNWRTLVARGRLAQARSILEKALEADPNDLDVLQGLVLVAEASGDRQGLVRYSDRLVEIRESAANRVDQLILLLRSGLVKQAQERLQVLRSRYPDQPDTGALEAWLSIRTGRLDQARQRIEQAIGSQDAGGLAWTVKGHLDMLAGRFEEAAEAFSKGLERHQDPGVRVILAHAYRLAGRTKEAADLFLELLAEPSVAWQALSGLQQVYAGPQGSTVLQQACHRLERQYADQPRWLNRLGLLALSAGRHEKASELFSRSMEILRQYYGEDSGSLYSDPDYMNACEGRLRADVQAAGSDKAALEEALARAARQVRGPVAPRLLCWTALAKYRLGDSAGGSADAREALELAGPDLQALEYVTSQLVEVMGGDRLAKELEQLGQGGTAYWAAKAQLAVRAGRFDQALQAMDRYMALPGIQSTDARLYRAQVLVLAYEGTADNRYLADALALYKDLASQMPDNSTVMNNLAYLMCHDEAWVRQALQIAGQALQLAADSPVVMDTYGYALYRNGRLEEALDWLLAAARQFQVNGTPVPADVYEHIGMAYQALGRKDEALEAFRKGLAAAGEGSPVQARIRAAMGRLGPD